MNPLRLLVDTSGFPARWHCGSWTVAHGWVHILADLSIFGAYAAIPAVIAFFALRRKDLPFPRLAWLFVAFIASCGVGHLVEATIFWHPWYRLSALVKVWTAVASWLTVAALAVIAPRALALPGIARLNDELARELAARRRAEEELAAANAALRDHEAELEEQARELARSNEALEQFAYAASHDLQEPLRKVVMFCEMLREEKAAALDDEARTYLGFAIDGGRRMQGLVRGLLELSRVESAAASGELVDADAALRAALENLADAAREAGAEVTAGPLGAVVADATQLEQVFRNLIGNALKYRAPGRPPRVRVEAQREPDRVTITVRDNGIGIPTGRVEEAFLPFRRLNPRHESPGSGLGLTLCRRIVAHWGGGLDATSEEGVGSVFRVTLRAVGRPRSVSRAPDRPGP